MRVDTIQERNWRALKAALSAYFVLGAALMLLTPESLVTEIPGFTRAAVLVGNAIPGVARMSHISPFPGVMALVLTVLWIGLPIGAARIYQLWTFPPRLFELKKKDLWFLIATIWGIAAVLVLPLYLFFDVSRAELVAAGGRGGWLLTALTQSRVAAALLVPIWFCASAMCLGIAAGLPARAAAAKRAGLDPR